jgi:nucleotide-binding universal stress UspA family protein
MRDLTIRSILVATDLLPTSDVAVRGAALLAKALGAELHVIHALNIPRSGYPLTGMAVSFQAQVHEARRQLAAQIERAVPEEMAVASQVVKLDTPQQAINERVRTIGAGLIVLGPHQQRAFRGPIMGNTADRVLRSAEVPVLILSELLSLPLSRVVVPMDLSDPARGALDQGLVWAGRLGRHDPATDRLAVEVRVMHVIPRVYEVYDFPFDRAVIAPQLNREIDEAVERVEATRQIDTHEEIVWGNSPADEIIRYVETEEADLLVMGTHGYGALGRALIGSITSMVARMAPCPILLVPPALWNASDPDHAIPIDAELSEPALP